MTDGHNIIVMGVSGSGKSVVGGALAATLGLRFVDADDHHSPANVSKMSNGIPLTDADRSSWLDGLAALLSENHGIVLACSALKARYRLRLCAINAAPPIFIHLDGSFNAIHDRLMSREGHYFSGREMLEDQFRTLEAPGPEEAIIVSVDNASIEHVVDRCVKALNRHAHLE